MSAFRAQAGASSVSLDQHSTAPENGTFLQRVIFHLPGLTAAIDELNANSPALSPTCSTWTTGLLRRQSPSGLPSWHEKKASVRDHRPFVVFVLRAMGVRVARPYRYCYGLHHRCSDRHANMVNVGGFGRSNSGSP
ncbi:hypothetical protein AWC22_04165 [Mycobacterium riyadhense]|uniref:Uncharacterized protein n=1 Tax=Mycobacterium riyadhense TaxID=486698 RepID=A0A1X2BGA4_9MYCO|nr:hypothetical protein AWC22_04165 [Mycobacterium riyadhense]